MKIIVIDDDKLVALSLKTILENTGSIEIAAMGHSGGGGYRPLPPAQA